MKAKKNSFVIKTRTGVNYKAAASLVENANELGKKDKINI